MTTAIDFLQFGIEPMKVNDTELWQCLVFECNCLYVSHLGNNIIRSWRSDHLPDCLKDVLSIIKATGFVAQYSPLSSLAMFYSMPKSLPDEYKEIGWATRLATTVSAYNMWPISDCKCEDRWLYNVMLSWEQLEDLKGG